MSDQSAPGRTIPGQKIPEQATPDATTTTPPRVPEQAAPEAAPEGPAPTGRRHLLRRSRPRRQSAFRRWRKTRPFWGGVFAMLAGAEIAAITGTTYELLLVSRSVSFAITVGVVIWVFGLTMWLSPQLSKLLGLLTLVAALLSFVTSDLGGFLLGMLLAIVGGALSFAWEPGQAVVQIRVDDTDDTDDTDELGAGPDIPRQRAPGSAVEADGD